MHKMSSIKHFHKKMNQEFRSYQKEGKLTIEENPILWWFNRKEEYPLMIKLARKYLCVMGTSTPAERVFSRMGRVLSKSRMAMSDKLFSTLMFLSDCNI